VDLQDRLGLERPILQAGMGGGLATAELAAAVSNAGGLGTVGIFADPQTMAAELRKAKELAPGRPVAANLLVPFARRGHVDACIEAGVEAVVLFAGFAPRIVERLKAKGIYVLHQIGTVPQAKHARADGADALIAQGIEAGGHVEGTQPALKALQDVQRISKDQPVLLAGGIADSNGTKTALQAGAAAIVSGSRFLLTDECRAHPAYKARVLKAPQTITTELFGLGWPLKHRVVPNKATERWGNFAPVNAFNRLTAPVLQRAPAGLANRMATLQRQHIPLYGPAALIEGMDEKLLEVMPLYAGECVREIEQIVPAAQAVQMLNPT
jgi:nitronate monooxygenase